MAERASALAHHPDAAPAGAVVRLSEIRPGSILQVSAWPDTLGAVQEVIADLLGVQPPGVGMGLADPNITVACVAPGRFLIAGMAPDLAMRFEAALPSEDGAVTDLSHGRVILRLDGEAARLLASAVAIDLHPSVFPPGRVAQTMIHHIDVVIHHLTATRFDLWILRGFAQSLLEWLLDAGVEMGVSFERRKV
jgi:heterotetrameric sarcosine oxidase gamma subunit